MKKIIIGIAAVAFLFGTALGNNYSENKIEDLYFEIEEAYDNGYFDGTDEGYNEGYEEGINFGYEEGYSEGYSVGFEEGETEVLDTLSEANETYDDGYEDGFEIGYSSGYEDGFADGKNSSVKSAPKAETKESAEAKIDYVLNKNTKKFHYPYCSSVNDMKASNRWNFSGSREEVIAKGYVPCKRCNP